MTRASRRSPQPLRAGIPVLVVALTILPSVLSTPAAADWLVMDDGARVETDGPWTERGKLIVFTDTTGRLVSMRLAEVDLDASRRVTREAVEAASRSTMESPPIPPRPSVFRLTDDDVAHIDDDDELTADGEGNDLEAVATPLIGVVAWERDETPAGDGLEIRATLENQGTDVAVNLVINVTIYDDTGEVLATSPGLLAANGLTPGQTTEMVATFPEIFDFTAVDFDVKHRAIATRPVEEAPALGDDFGTDG